MSVERPSTPFDSAFRAPGGLRIAMVAARFNADIVEGLVAGTLGRLQELGVKDPTCLLRVPGAWELPEACQRIIRRERPHAVIAIGAVVRGDTPHFEFVAGECGRGLMRVALDSQTPVIFGVLTTDTLEQALERSDPERLNKGRDFAEAAVEMGLLALDDAG
ncbi:MAG: 6,7-dimethyl-8-ribityllumazine synthase [Myxococcales bacterium]|nr:6,7-dimethyl-8-ribityllumazine synthase [Myxococcales bacterium]